jgi:hypothetical protein
MVNKIDSENGTAPEAENSACCDIVNVDGNLSSADVCKAEQEAGSTADDENIEDLVAVQIQKDDMITLLEKSKDDNPEVFNILIKMIERQYDQED